MLQQSHIRRLALWLGFWAMLLAVLGPLAYTAQGMGLLSQAVCGEKASGNSADGKNKLHSECQLCQFAQHLGKGFAPPVAINAKTIFFAEGLADWGKSFVLPSSLLLDRSQWPRGPPSLV